MRSHRLPSREGTGVGFFVLGLCGCAVLQFCSQLPLNPLKGTLTKPPLGGRGEYKIGWIANWTLFRLQMPYLLPFYFFPANPPKASSRELIFDSVSAFFFLSSSRTEDGAFCTNLSLLSFFITESRNPLR